MGGKWLFLFSALALLTLSSFAFSTIIVEDINEDIKVCWYIPGLGKAGPCRFLSSLEADANLASFTLSDILPDVNFENIPVTDSPMPLMQAPNSSQDDENRVVVRPVVPPRVGIASPIVYDYKNIEESVLQAADAFSSSEPGLVFHLKVLIELSNGQLRSGLNPVTLKRNYNAIVQKADLSANTMYVDVPAKNVKSFAVLADWVEFDPAFEKPALLKSPINKGHNLNSAISEKQENQMPSVNVNFHIEEKPESIIISKNQDKNAIVIDSNGFKAETSEHLKIDNNGLKVAGKQVQVLPDKAVQKTQQASSVAKDVKLKVINEAPVYEIKAVQKARLLWILPVEMEVKAIVNAQTGNVESVEKPWWSFLTG